MKLSNKLTPLIISSIEKIFLLMIKVPCEHIMWDLLPKIRKEFALSMINDFGLTQKATAEKLGITPAAVCQYISNKRGEKIKIKINEEVTKEIAVSVKKIVENGSDSIINEICRICKLIRSNGDYPELCKIEK